MDAQQQTRNFPSPSGSEPGGSNRSITDHANEALRQVSETAQQAQAQAREAVANLSTEATGSVKDLLNHQVFAGVYVHEERVPDKRHKQQGHQQKNAPDDECSPPAAQRLYVIAEFETIRCVTHVRES